MGQVMKTQIPPEVRQKPEVKTNQGALQQTGVGTPYLKGAAAELLTLSWFLSHAEWEPSVARSPDFFNRSQESGFLCEVRFFFMLVPILIGRKRQKRRRRKESMEGRERERKTMWKLPEGQMLPQWNGGSQCQDCSRTLRVDAHGSNAKSLQKVTRVHYNHCPA